MGARKSRGFFYENVLPDVKPMPLIMDRLAPALLQLHVYRCVLHASSAEVLRRALLCADEAVISHTILIHRIDDPTAKRSAIQLLTTERDLSLNDRQIERDLSMFKVMFQ